MNIDDISPELKEKAKACESADELMDLAQKEGIELSREQLDAMSGGVDWLNEECPAYEDNKKCLVYLP